MNSQKSLSSYFLNQASKLAEKFFRDMEKISISLKIFPESPEFPIVSRHSKFFYTSLVLVIPGKALQNLLWSFNYHSLEGFFWEHETLFLYFLLFLLAIHGETLSTKRPSFVPEKCLKKTIEKRLLILDWWCESFFCRVSPKKALALFDSLFVTRFSQIRGMTCPLALNLKRTWNIR